MSNKGKSKPSRFYASISIAIVLFLLGLFVMIFLHANNLTNILKERIGIIVELKEDISPESYTKIKSALADNPRVKKGSIVHFTKEDALDMMKKGINMDVSKDENPFLDVLRFNIAADQYDEAYIKQLKGDLERYAGVYHVYHENATIQQLKSNLKRISYILFVLGLIFVLLSIVIIRNTLSLSLYADRKEIKTMQLVGAKEFFVKLPYIKSSLILGLNAFVFAGSMIAVVVGLCKLYIPDVFGVLDWIYIAITYLFMAIIALIIPAVVTEATTSRYLKESD